MFKQRCFIYFFILFALRGFSQNNVATHFYNDYPTRILAINGFKFILGEVHTKIFDTISITGISPNGAIKFRKSINLFELSTINSAVITADSCLWAVGSYTNACDVSCMGGSFFIKIDTNGVQKFFKTTTTAYDNTCITGYTCVFNFQKYCLVFKKDTAQLYDLNDSLISTLPSSAGIVNSGLSDTSLFVVSNTIYQNYSPTHYISVVDGLGLLLYSVPTNYAFKKMIKGPIGYYFGLTHFGELVKIDAAFNTIATSTLSQGNFKISDFEIKDDTLYACTSNSLTLLKFDKNLNVVFQKNNPYSNVFFTGLTVSQNSLTLIGTETTSITSVHPNGIVFYTDLSGEVVLKNDAFVKNCSILNYSLSMPSSTISPIYVDFRYNLSVNVFNNCADTLKSIYLNYYDNSYQPIGCGTKFFHHLITNINVPPYDSVNIVTPIIQGYIEHNTSASNDSIVFANFCAWTSAPNFKGDANHVNDAFCKALVFPIVTEISSLKNDQDKGVLIYPNPSSNNIIIELNKNLTNCKILLFDVNGNELELHNYTSTINQLTLENYSAGIYFVKIFNKDEVIVRKIIKL